MKSSKYLIVIFLLSFLSLKASFAQNIVGLWNIHKVEVGEKDMTPVAKWTQIKKDGSFISGNGYLRNAYGSYTYNAKEATISFYDSMGTKDVNPAFKIQFKGKDMLWEREEEGMPVKVYLSPINELPKSTADQITGMWKVKSEGMEYNFLHIRWDRRYNQLGGQIDRQGGYWHIHGHMPRLTFLPFSEEQDAESWEAKASYEQLTLTGLSDSNKGKVLIFERINYYPK